MSLKKRMLAVLAVLMVSVVGVLFVLPGFEKRTDVCLQDFYISEDGSVMILQTSLSGSMGFIRAMETEQIGNEIHCSFYRTFGGLNSGIGAKNRFELRLDGTAGKIYFDRGTEPGLIVLERDAADDVWRRRLPGTSE